MKTKLFFILICISSVLANDQQCVDLVIPDPLPQPLPPGLLVFRNFLLPLLTGVYNYATSLFTSLNNLPYSLPVDILVLKQNIVQVYNQALLLDSVLQKAQDTTKNIFNSSGRLEIELPAKLRLLKTKAELASKCTKFDTNAKLFLTTVGPFFEAAIKGLKKKVL